MISQDIERKREFKIDLGVENSPAIFSLNKPFIP